MGNLTPEEIARNGAINAENIAKLAGEQAKDYGKRHWYPSVDADGNLTWEKSKSDAKPRSVNIRGPQGTSGIMGEVPDLTVVNSLDGGESEPGSVKVLAAEQGKVLKELIDKKPGKIVEGGEIFNHESNTINSGGVNNHAEGQGTTCNGSCNHSEGRNTQTFGVGSHSEGDGTVAGGNASHSEGMGTATAVVAGHVEGKYNAATDSIHIVGGGTSEDDRKNLHEIKSDGSQYMIGVGGYDGTNRDDSKSLQELLTELDEGIKNKPKGYSRVDLQKNLSSTTLTEAEAPESALRLEAGANILIGKGENGSVVISATYSSSGGDGIIIIQ